MDTHTGLNTCCTCGVVKHWSELDCGHYISRSVFRTRFDPNNCDAQCVECNRMHNGRKAKHRTHLKRRIGLKNLELLEARAKRSDLERMSVESLLNIMKLYRQLNKPTDE